MLQYRSPLQRQEHEEGSGPGSFELEELLPGDRHENDDAAYTERVEAAKATCRQRRCCTYLVLLVYLILFVIYLRKRNNTR
jgi:hypothetical protein